MKLLSCASRTAQDLLQFIGTGEREKSLKVLEIYSQLQKQEDRVPFFLRSLLDSGDSSPTNRQLYETLSQELGFSDSDVDEACKTGDFKRRSLSKRRVMKRRTGSASSGIETAQSSTSSIRNVQSPSPSHMSDGIFRHASLDSPGSADLLITYLQQENVRLHQEIARLNQQLESSNRLLTEAQRKLENAQSQPKLSYQFGLSPVQTRSRRISSHAQISPSSESRIRKVSRSLDSIQHQLIELELEHQKIAEMMEPGHAEFPMVMFNRTSSRLRDKTTKGYPLMEFMPNSKMARRTLSIGTHDGKFHCDEVLACYMLCSLLEYCDAEIKRSRDPAVLGEYDIVVDVAHH